VTREARFTATILLPAKLLWPLPAKPDPPLPACSLQTHFHPYQRSRIHHWYQLAPSKARMSERWDQACQSSRTKYVRVMEVKPDPKASCQLKANPDSLLPAKPCPLLPICSQQSQIRCYQQSQVHPTSKAGSTTASLLPAKQDCQRGESEHSTATSLLTAKPGTLLPAKSVSPLPAMPDPPLLACPWRIQFHPDWPSQMHHNKLAPSEARLSER